MIAIVDYGAGNLRSVTNAITRLGYQPRVTSSPSEMISVAREMRCIAMSR